MYIDYSNHLFEYHDMTEGYWSGKKGWPLPPQWQDAE
jgi:hypothetical protein